MKTTAAPLLILFSYGLICHDYGPLSSALETFLLVAILCLYYCITVPLTKKSLQVFVIYGAAALSIGWVSGPVLQLACLALLMFGLYVYAKNEHPGSVEHAVSFLTTVLFCLAVFLYEYFPEGWYVGEYFADVFSGICSAVYFQKVRVGPTAFGLFILAAFVMYCAVLFALERKRRPLRFIVTLVFLFAVCVAHVGLRIGLAAVVQKYTYLIMRPDLHTQVLLFALLSLSVFINRGIQLRPASFFPAARTVRWCAPAAIICFAAFLGMHLWPVVDNTPLDLKTVKFYRKGSLDWKVPRFGTYGKRSGGMFGIMPRYLKWLGFRSRMIDSLTPVKLADADVLVMINLNEHLSRKEVLCVLQFVHNGGGLLLLGDHTNLGGLMVNFNRLLHFVPMRFAFDSAMPSRYTWDTLMDIRPHPITNGFAREITRSWWVGASIACRYPAVPLVIGKYCYSDWGYKHNKKKAYLGNRRFDYYERENDVVLAAAASYGRGKIMACGDTSAFHNTTFMETYPFVVNTFRLLADRDHPAAARSPAWIKIILLCAIVGCGILFFIGGAHLLSPLAVVIILGAGATISGTAERGGQLSDPIPYQNIDVAYIDYVHNGRFDLMSWEDDSIGGLKNNLLRNKYYPFLLRAFDTGKIMQSKLFISIAPTRAYTPQETAAVMNFVKSGGTLLLSVGWEEKEASMPLLTALGMDIDNTPLARCEYTLSYATARKNKKSRKKITAHFSEAWPVIYEESDAIDVICRPMGYPVIVQKHVGSGRAIVIGDSKFLLNNNLEDDDSYSVQNMLLLRRLLRN